MTSLIRSLHLTTSMEPAPAASWHRLEVSHAAPSVMLQLDDSRARGGLLPLAGNKTVHLIKLCKPARVLHLFTTAPAAKICANLRPARAHDFAAFVTNVLRQRSSRKIRFDSDDLAFFLGGIEPLTRAETKALVRRYRARNGADRIIRQFQLSNHHCAELYPTIDNDWTCRDRVLQTASGLPNDVAVCVHLFHTDCWPDFCFALSNCPLSVDLHVSLPGGQQQLATEIARQFPEATLHFFENRGRDIWPFVSLLQAGVFDRYVTVCKLHSKMSAHLSNHDIDFDIGRRWRRSAILELMGTRERTGRILERFRSEPSTGIIGPSNLWLRQSSDHMPKNDWGALKNRPRMAQLARHLAIPERDLRTDFFAGSMFWFAPKALATLAHMDLDANDFEPEPISEEGALPHAFERIFNIVARRAGYDVSDSRSV